jgi:hypothetical protein
VFGSWASAAAPPSTAFGNGAAPHCWHCLYPDRRRAPSSSRFHNLARSCADSDWRSGVNQGRGAIALPAHRLYYPVDMWPRSTTRGFCGDLRGAPWSHSARACSNSRPQRLPPFLPVRPRALWLKCGPVEKKKTASHPGREPRGCLHAGGEKRGHLAAPGRQKK